MAKSIVLEHPVGDEALAHEHFRARLGLATDPSDVHADLEAGETGFIVLDARSPEAYAAGHVPGAVSFPHRRMDAASAAALPRDKVIVTYCDGIGCNASTKAAFKLTALGFRVKEMIGGLEWWQRDGYPVATGAGPAGGRGDGRVRVLSVALATCARLPDLSADDRMLQEELRRRGVDARPAVWNDSGVAWAAFDRVVIRSTWDYHVSLPEFLAWLDLLEGRRIPLWNPAPLVRANAHKSYLKELEAAGLPVVPTAWIGRGSDVDLACVLEARGWAEAVVKPAVSASAFRTWRVSATKAARSQCRHDLRRLLAEGDVLVQRFLPEVQREGEWSFVFFAGEFSHAVLKRPALGDFRVQEEMGGSVVAATPAPSAVRDAQMFAAHVPVPWAYARIDGVLADGRLTLMEIELIEPQLFLRRHPLAAVRLADAILSTDGDGEARATRASP